MLHYLHRRVLRTSSSIRKIKRRKISPTLALLVIACKFFICLMAISIISVFSMRPLPFFKYSCGISLDRSAKQLFMRSRRRFSMIRCDIGSCLRNTELFQIRTSLFGNAWRACRELHRACERVDFGKLILKCRQITKVIFFRKEKNDFRFCWLISPNCNNIFLGCRYTWTLKCASVHCTVWMYSKRRKSWTHLYE